MSGEDEETTEAEQAEVEEAEVEETDEVEGFAFKGLGKIGNLAATDGEVPTIYTTRMRTGGPGDEFSKRP